MPVRTQLAPLAAALVMAGAVPAAAEPPPRNSSTLNWGTVVSTSEAVQANAWTVRLLGLAGRTDVRLGEVHHPATPDAPRTLSGAPLQAEELRSDGRSFGHIKDVRNRTIAEDGEIVAQARVGELELGLPYAAGPEGGIQRSPFGLLFKDAVATAVARPGKPVALTSSVAGGYLSSYGKKAYSFTGSTPVNHGFRFPPDPLKPPQLMVTLNEQITTDGQGHPTTGSDGLFAPDKKALGGYVNAAHVSVLAPEAADVTIGHAAVLRAPGPRD